MSELLNVSSNPHVRDKISTSRIMIDVLISLLPASAFGIYNFGIRAFVVILVTMVSCVLAEFLFNMVLKKDQTISEEKAEEPVSGEIVKSEEPEKPEVVQEQDDDEDAGTSQGGGDGRRPSISFLNLGDIFGGGFGGRQQPKVKKKKKDGPKPVFSIDNIPAPHKIKEELDKYVIGQERAKKVISVAAYNHCV